MPDTQTIEARLRLVTAMPNAKIKDLQAVEAWLLGDTTLAAVEAERDALAEELAAAKTRIADLEKAIVPPSTPVSVSG